MVEIRLLLRWVCGAGGCCCCYVFFYFIFILNKSSSGLVVVVAVGGCHWVGCASGGDCGSCFI